MTQTMEAPAGTLARQEDNGEQAAHPPRINPAMTSRGIQLRTMDELAKFASTVASSGLAPKGVSTPQQIFVAVQMGLEVGLSPMAALQSIAVINGRPSIYGDAALALVRSSEVYDYYLELPSNDEVHALVEELAVYLEFQETTEIKRMRLAIQKASVGMDRTSGDFGYSSISRRKGSIASIVRRFTYEDAKRADLLGKPGPWKQYPERMLMWRCRGFNLRDNFGDVLKGLATAEEAYDVPPAGAGVTMVASSAPTSRTQALLDRVTQRPVSEGQQFIADENANAAVAAQDSTPGETIDHATGEVTPATPEPEVEPAHHEPAPPEPTEPKDFTSHEKLVNHLNNAAMAMGRDEASIHHGLGISIPAGKENKMTPAERRKIWRDYVSLTGAWAPVS